MELAAVYTAIVIVVALGLAWINVHFFKKPPPPSHYEDLQAELRQAQRDALDELNRAEKSAALAEVYHQRVRRLKQEIEDEDAGTAVRTGEYVPGIIAMREAAYA